MTTTQWFSSTGFVIPRYPDDAPDMRIEDVTGTQVTERRVEVPGDAIVMSWFDNGTALLSLHGSYSIVRFDTASVILLISFEAYARYHIEPPEEAGGLFHVRVYDDGWEHVANYTVSLN